MTLQRPVLIVVGDKARARIFDTDTEDRSLREIDDLVNPSYRHHERETGDDRPGRGVNGAGRRTALGQDYTKRRILAARFAEKVADRVGECVKGQRYARIYLVAGPTFLGLLRPCLTSRGKQPPIAKVVKELTRHSVEDIRKHLPEPLR